MAGARKLSTRILRLQVAVLVATLLVGFALSLWQVRTLLVHQFEERALAIANTVTVEPGIADLVLAGDPTGTVQQRAEAIRQSTGALFVVITDANGIRLSHPNPDRLGEVVSTDPGPALSGETVMTVQRGTLGLSARAKVPLRAADRHIVGEVSVGIDAGEIDSRLLRLVPSIALYSGLALAIGVLASLILARRLKRQTFGLELGEIAGLLQEREAMLHGIREGMVGVGIDGRVGLINDEARRLLGLRRTGIGEPISDLVPAGRLREVLTGELAGTDQVVLTDDFCLVVNRMPITLQGRDLGAVLTLSDRTEQEGLLRELDSVRGLTDALRAQQHEFANRVHALAGMLELGHVDEATRYALEISGTDADLAGQLQQQIGNPQLVGLLVAKSVVAAERGVQLTLTPDSEIGPADADSRLLLTVVGNLVDNAIEAAADGVPPGLVEVSLICAGPDLLIRVVDSGPGIPAGAESEIFSDGYSTKESVGVRRRGLGLALVHRIIGRHGGRIVVKGGSGASFTVRLPRGRAGASKAPSR
jgi:two-component system CitB family sensor kinase